MSSAGVGGGSTVRARTGTPHAPWWLPLAVALTLAMAGAGRTHAESGTAPPAAPSIESTLLGHPQDALERLAALTQDDAKAEPAERRYRAGLKAQALLQAGRVAEARELAAQQAAEARERADPLQAAEAKLIESAVQWRTGDAAKSNDLALEAQEALRNSGDLFLEHWAALAAATASRARGQFEGALDNLHAAVAVADRAQDPNRRAAARYQLSVLMLALKDAARAQEEAREAFRQATLARNPYMMAKAKMAESAALEALDRPVDEITALEDALAIARTTGSATAESLALVNLADIYLRRRDFRSAFELARAALDAARVYDDLSLMATAKANMGFALLAQGKVEAGKRLADEAVADYERAGATAEIAGLLGEYAHYVEGVGDYKAALALFHRERKLNDEIATAAHDRAVLELQGRYETERRRVEIDRLNHENTLKSAELQQRQGTERMLWVLALAFAAMFCIVVALYRKLRVTNRLLGERNRDLQSLNGTDPLTSLYNRRHFQDFIAAEPIAGDRRRQGLAADVQGVLLIDLDHFKTINDRYGHAAGDAVLIAMSARLRETLREEDMIVRWGGEEFLVFIPAVTIGRLEDVALRIMDTISAAPVLHDGVAIRATASIGYAPMPLPPHDLKLSWERALALVDKALYMAKVHGRNRAYGIAAFLRTDPDAIAAALQDLESAARDGIVEMRVLINGPRPVTLAAPAPSGLDLAA